jgi:hypothetical protein
MSYKEFRGNFRRNDFKNKNINISRERRIKEVKPEALERSQFNNMVVDEIVFHDKEKNIKIKGKQLNLYTLMPSRPILNCPYIKLGMTYTDPKDKRTFFQIRMCLLDSTIPTVCRMTTERKNKGRCFGNYVKGSSIDFWIVSNGVIDDGIEKHSFKVAFLNKNKLKFDKEEFSVNPNIEKANSLKNLYQALKSGTKYLETIPKPGNLIFHTLFSGMVMLKAVNLMGEGISGIAKGYENVPGGQPSLKVWINETKEVMLPLYMIGYMIIDNYDVDQLAKRSLKLMMNGHIIIPHRGNNTILDICRSDRKNDMIIMMSGDINPFDPNNNHDLDVRNILSQNE